MAIASILDVGNLALVAELLAILAATWLAVIVTQRRYFHPLSRFPGPFINALSPLPVTLGLLSGRQHAYIKRLHEKYGSVVRVSPTELSFVGPNAWEDIYGYRKNGRSLEKDPLFLGGIQPVAGSYALTMAPWEEHSRQRRALAHPFSNTALVQQEPLIQGHMDTFVSCLAKLAGPDGLDPVNVSDWLSYATFDIIGDLVFAEPFGCMEAGQSTEWSKSVVKAIKCGAWEQATRRAAGTGTWLQRQMVAWLIPEQYRRWRLNHFLKSKEKALKRLADQDADHRDLIYFMLRNAESTKGLTQMEILLNSALFIGAGSDTTAFTLTGLVYLLGSTPRALSKLAAEVRGAFPGPDPSEITHAATLKLPYLAAVLSEGLRLYSPVVTGLLRTVAGPQAGGEEDAATAGVEIDGHAVPPNTTVSVAPYAATHMRRNFARPAEFWPERWLDDYGGDEGLRDVFEGDNRAASQPFLLGPRGCIGKNLSYIEQRLIVCKLLWHFDLELVRKGGEGVTREMLRANDMWVVEGDNKNLKGYLVWDKPDLWVKLTPVKRG